MTECNYFTKEELAKRYNKLIATRRECKVLKDNADLTRKLRVLNGLLRSETTAESIQAILNQLHTCETDALTIFCDNL